MSEVDVAWCGVHDVRVWSVGHWTLVGRRSRYVERCRSRFACWRARERAPGRTDSAWSRRACDRRRALAGRPPARWRRSAGQEDCSAGDGECCAPPTSAGCCSNLTLSQAHTHTHTGMPTCCSLTIARTSIQWRNFFTPYLCQLRQLLSPHDVGQALRNICYCDIIFLVRLKTMIIRTCYQTNWFNFTQITQEIFTT